MPTNSHKSRLIWKHNSFLGGTAFARQNMRAIQQSETATKSSKELARKIENELLVLAETLKERIDPK